MCVYFHSDCFFPLSDPKPLRKHRFPTASHSSSFSPLARKAILRSAAFASDSSLPAAAMQRKEGKERNERKERRERDTN